MNFDTFASEWKGRRVIDPLLIGHGETAATAYQCVSLIKQYMVETKGIHIDWPGNAIDFWYRTNQSILAGFTKQTDIQKGDIVVLHTIGYNDATQPGHIGISTGNGDPNSIEILEQNGLGSGTGLGRDAIGTRFVPRNRIAGTLRPIPVAAPVSPPPYAYTEKPAFSVWAKYPVTVWNLKTLEPIGQRPANEEVKVVAVAQHQNGKYYYMYDIHAPAGYWAEDMTTIKPAPLPPPVITPPAAPIEIKKAEKYTLVTTVMAFDSAQGAQMHKGTAKPLGPGEYFVRDKNVQAYNLSTDNMKDQNTWINTTDNVEPAPVPPKLEVVPLPPRVVEVIENAAKDIPIDTPPAPAIPDWQKSRSFFNTDGSPEFFYSINTTVMDIPDLSTSNNAPAPLQPLSRHIPIVATYEKDGMLWGLPQNSYDRGNLYLIPLRVLKLERKSFAEVVEEAINDLRIADRFNQTRYRVTRFIDAIKETRAGKK